MTPTVGEKGGGGGGPVSLDLDRSRTLGLGGVVASKPQGCQHKHHHNHGGFEVPGCWPRRRRFVTAFAQGAWASHALYLMHLPLRSAKVLFFARPAWVSISASPFHNL